MTKDMGWKQKEEGRKKKFAAKAEGRIDSQACDHSYSRSWGRSIAYLSYRVNSTVYSKTLPQIKNYEEGDIGLSGGGIDLD